MSGEMVISSFIHGALMLAFGVIGLFFLRFWRESRDRLFLLFSIAFFLMAINRIGFVLTGTESELRTYLYFVRLTAFSLIILAIVDKNIPAKKQSNTEIQ